MKLSIGSFDKARSELLDEIMKNPFVWKSTFRMMPNQIIEWVINRRKGLSLSGLPGFCWVTIDWVEDEWEKTTKKGKPVLNRWGEQVVVRQRYLDATIDSGPYQHGIWKDTPNGGRTNVRYNPVADHVSENGAMPSLFPDVDYRHSDYAYPLAMAQGGLVPGQQFLCRMEANWHRSGGYDSGDEWDEDWYVDILYADPAEAPEEWLDAVLEAGRDIRLDVEERAADDLAREKRMAARKFAEKLIASKSKPDPMTTVGLTAIRKKEAENEEKKRRYSSW